MRIRVRDVRLFVEVVGTKIARVDDRFVERPTVVLAHGGPALDHYSQRSWDALADTAQLVYYDHRGIGRSDRGTPDRWNLETWADDLRALCDALELERPIVLGHSLGSMIALEYAIRHADHPAGVVLVTPDLRREVDRTIDAFGALGGAEARAAAERAYGERSEDARAEFWRICGPLITQSSVDPATLSSTPANEELVDATREHLGRIDFGGRLEGVRMPMLLIAGELDPLSPPQNARDLHAELPHARLEVVSGAGHAVQRDAPEVVFPLIREFIGAHSG